MSYRAFKHLLGETSLERKCHFLFGAITLLLMFGSFWLYAHLTEGLAYEQIETSCRLLVNPIIAKKHLDSDRQKALEEFWEEHWDEALGHYTYRIIKPGDLREE